MEEPVVDVLLDQLRVPDEVVEEQRPTDGQQHPDQRVQPDRGPDVGRVAGFDGVGDYRRRERQQPGGEQQAQVGPVQPRSIRPIRWNVALWFSYTTPT